MSTYPTTYRSKSDKAIEAKAAKAASTGGLSETDPTLGLLVGSASPVATAGATAIDTGMRFGRHGTVGSQLGRSNVDPVEAWERLRRFRLKQLRDQIKSMTQQDREKLARSALRTALRIAARTHPVARVATAALELAQWAPPRAGTPGTRDLNDPTQAAITWPAGWTVYNGIGEVAFDPAGGADSHSADNDKRLLGETPDWIVLDHIANDTGGTDARDQWVADWPARISNLDPATVFDSLPPPIIFFGDHYSLNPGFAGSKGTSSDWIAERTSGTLVPQWTNPVAPATPDFPGYYAPPEVTVDYPEALPIMKPVREPATLPKPRKAEPGTQPARPREHPFRGPEVIPLPTFPLPVVVVPPHIAPDVAPQPARTVVTTTRTKTDIKWKPSRTHPRQRAPGARTKERKITVRTVAGAAWGAINLFTEGLDFLEVLHASIPKDKRTKPGPRGLRPDQILHDIYRHFEDIDVASAVAGHLNNQLEDFYYGIQGKPTKKLMQQTGQSTGLDHALAQAQKSANPDFETPLPELHYDTVSGEWSFSWDAVGLSKVSMGSIPTGKTMGALIRDINGS